MRKRFVVVPLVILTLAGCGGSDGAPGAALTCTTRDQPARTVKTHAEITAHANHSILVAAVDFGDGSTFLNSKAPETYTYSRPGNYEITLVAIDRGKTGTDTCSVNVK